MTNVYKWPPVSEVAFEITKVDPVSSSTSLIDGQPIYSRFGRSRRYAKTQISGIGLDAAGAGYMEMLKEYLDGGVNLVRIDVYSAIWHLVRAQNNPNLAQEPLSWVAGEDNLYWTNGVNDILWFSNPGILSTNITDSAGYPAIKVEGLPANVIVARPHENVSVYSDATTKETRKVVTVARSNSSGVAIIRVTSAFTVEGPVKIGDTESIVFRAYNGLPRSTQPQSGDWYYDWEFVEAFEDEYSDGFTEVTDIWESAEE